MNNLRLTETIGNSLFVRRKLTFPRCRIASATCTDVLERDLGRAYEVRDQAAIVPCGPKQFLTLRVAIVPEISAHRPETER